MLADLAGMSDNFLIDLYHDGVITCRPFVCQEGLYSRPEVSVLRARGAFIVEIAPNDITSDSNSQVSLKAVLFPIAWDWMFSVRVEKSHFVSDGSFEFPIHEGHLSSSYSYRRGACSLMSSVSKVCSAQ